MTTWVTLLHFLSFQAKTFLEEVLCTLFQTTPEGLRRIQSASENIFYFPTTYYNLHSQDPQFFQSGQSLKQQSLAKLLDTNQPWSIPVKQSPLKKVYRTARKNKRSRKTIACIVYSTLWTVMNSWLTLRCCLKDLVLSIEEHSLSSIDKVGCSELLLSYYCYC